ncbi:MAG: hypothetical protein ACKOY8_03630 [Verrucomicrobiota bacterium]
MEARPLNTLLAAALVGLTGCTSDFANQAALVDETFAVGDYAASLEAATALAAEAEPNDAVIHKLKLASVQRASGKPAEAARTLEEAESLFSAYDAAPEVSLSAEGISAFSNPYALPYRGRAYDRTLAATYQALCLLQAGESGKARVAMNRALFRQEDARRLATEKARIASEEGAAATLADARSGEASRNDAVVAASAAAQALIKDLPAYKDYVNPFTSWLHGAFFLHRAEGAGDVERARKSLELASVLAPGCSAVKEDLADAAAGRPPSHPGETVVYVLHESGRSPVWSENKFTFPFIILDTSAPIISVALPELRPVAGQAEIAVSAGTSTRRGEEIVSVDALAAQEFNDEYPIARNRAVGSAIVKGIAAYAANKAAQEAAYRSDDPGGSFLSLATLVATNIYTTQSAQADLRNWSTLPKRITLTRLRVPGGSEIGLSVNGAGPVRHRLPDARAVILTCRTPAGGGPLSAETSILRSR